MAVCLIVQAFFSHTSDVTFAIGDRWQEVCFDGADPGPHLTALRNEVSCLLPDSEVTATETLVSPPLSAHRRSLRGAMESTLMQEKNML